MLPNTELLESLDVTKIDLIVCSYKPPPLSFGRQLYLPEAAEIPLRDPRTWSGNVSDGSMNVVEFGPKLAKKNVKLVRYESIHLRTGQEKVNYECLLATTKHASEPSYETSYRRNTLMTSHEFPLDATMYLI